MQFCCEKQIDPFKPDVNLVLEFLTGLYMKNLGYSALNTARCSISSFLSLSGDSCVRLGDHFLVKRFMRGDFGKTNFTKISFYMGCKQSVSISKVIVSC